MGEAGTFLVAATTVIGQVVRWLFLIGTTILVVCVAWLILGLIWSRSDKESISIRPFVVIDPSGNLKNGEIGFAQILTGQMAELQGRILKARALLVQAASGQSLALPQIEGVLAIPELSRRDGPEPPRIVDPPWPELKAAEQQQIEVKVEGIDVAGLFSWLKTQFKPERKGLAFTAHLGPDGEVTIAGDISDLGVDTVPTVYLPPVNHSSIAALNDLALRLFQVRLIKDDRHLGDVPQAEFGALVDKLIETADSRLLNDTSDERKGRYKQLSTYFAGMLDGRGDWVAMMILAAETARRGGDYDTARKYFQLAIDHENNLDEAQRNAERSALIATSLAAVRAPAAAQQRTAELITAAPAPIPRRVIDPSDAATIATLRQGFQALYDETGNRSFATIAGLHGVPGWYNWNHRQNSRSAQQLNLFLPWNRAFLVNLERAARAKVKDFALLCWDFTKGGIPTTFSEETTPDGKPNPLKGYQVNLPKSNPPIVRATVREPGVPNDLPTTADVANAMARSDWDGFSEALENISDIVHGWTGGDTGMVATGSYDPLYYALHCQVDRIWALWQSKQGDRAIDPKLLDVTLDPFGVKVREVLDIRKLGYEYQ